MLYTYPAREKHRVAGPNRPPPQGEAPTSSEDPIDHPKHGKASGPYVTCCLHVLQFVHALTVAYTPFLRLAVFTYAATK